MADQYVQVSPNSTGLKVDVSELTVNTQTVERQRVVIGDNATAANYAKIDSNGSLAVRTSDGTNFMPAGDAAARAIYSRVTDGTNQAAVKAASTAPVATDPALVIAISPNSPIQVMNLNPTTTGGLSTTQLISAASTNATSLKASAGQVYNIQAFNTNASARFLKLYNKASAPTVGTDTPVNTFLIPGNASGAGVVIEISNGLAFATGIAFAITGLMAVSDTTAVGASDVIVNIQYK